MRVSLLDSICLSFWQAQSLFTYTVTTDNKLSLFFGRFSRGKEIPLKDITSVERASSMRIGRFAVMRYVLIRYGEGKCVALLPVKEEEFIRLLEQRISR
mgnify:CR=1 FL=1